MPERRQRAELAGVSDQDVELFESLVQRGAEPVERIEIAEVKRHERGARPFLFDFVVEFLEPADGAGERHDMRALARERDGGGAADAARGAGDERDAIGKWFGHRCYLVIPAEWDEGRIIASDLAKIKRRFASARFGE